jgi:nicotinate-nucleotide adenylyltransferase
MPPYRKPPVAGVAQRLGMLRLALAGEPRYRIDERELDAGASGYTYDSMQALRGEHPQDELVLVMGADQYAKRESWYRWRDLEKICRIAVAARPDSPAPGGNCIPIPLSVSDISASDIRARVGRGEDIAAMVPAGVAAYIHEHHLYT